MDQVIRCLSEIPIYQGILYFTWESRRGGSGSSEHDSSISNLSVTGSSGPQNRGGHHLVPTLPRPPGAPPPRPLPRGRRAAPAPGPDEPRPRPRRAEPGHGRSAAAAATQGRRSPPGTARLRPPPPAGPARPAPGCPRAAGLVRLLRAAPGPLPRARRPRGPAHCQQPSPCRRGPTCWSPGLVPAQHLFHFRLETLIKAQRVETVTHVLAKREEKQ